MSQFASRDGTWTSLHFKHQNVLLFVKKVGYATCLFYSSSVIGAGSQA